GDGEQVVLLQEAVELVEELREPFAPGQGQGVAGPGERAAGDGREDGHMPEEARPVEVVEGAEVEGGGAEAAAGERQGDVAERCRGRGRAHGTSSEGCGARFQRAG